MSRSSEKLTFQSTDSVLQFAISKEEEAYHFYKYWQDRLKSKAVKEVMEELANEELNHKNLLLEVKAGKPFEKTPQKIIDLKIGDYFAEATPGEDMDYQKALQIAIQREIGARELYLYLQSISATKELQNLFDDLAREEARHKMRLEQMYDEDFLKEN